MVEVMMINRSELKSELREIFSELLEEAKAAQQPSDRLLTATETTKALGISLPTLWRWGKSGYLLPVRIGAKKLYKKSDIKKIMEGQA